MPSSIGPECGAPRRDPAVGAPPHWEFGDQMAEETVCMCSLCTLSGNLRGTLADSLVSRISCAKSAQCRLEDSTKNLRRSAEQLALVGIDDCGIAERRAVEVRFTAALGLSKHTSAFLVLALEVTRLRDCPARAS